jgi:hypothetical protein
MFRIEDIQALAAAHDQIRRDLARDAPRKAAKLICKELSKLSEDNGSFWENIQEASAKAADQRSRRNEVLGNLIHFIDDEGEILRALGVEDSQAGAILSDVYSMAAITREVSDALTPSALKLLREHTRAAAKIICEHSKGPFRRTVDWVFSTKGLKAIGGATIASANGFAILSSGIITPHLAPILIPKLAGIGSASLGVGLGMMGIEIKGITDAKDADKDRPK